MKQKNYKVDQDKKVEWIIAFIRKYLKLEDPESLVNYKALIQTRFIYFFMNAILEQLSYHLPLLQGFGYIGPELCLQYLSHLNLFK